VTGEGNVADTALPTLAATQRSCDLLVIGAGIIGTAIALRLQQEGQNVLLIDRERVAAQASRGNAGALAFSDILPLASPASCARRRDGCWIRSDPWRYVRVTCPDLRHGCSASGARAGPTTCARAPRHRRR
jgi:glycine/D-amino acid oxidase-like deaminating enzyme